MFRPAILLISLIFLNCKSTNKESQPEIEVKSAGNWINYYVVKAFPHDTLSFTEGLFVNKSIIFEGTGSPAELPLTRSLIGTIDTITGSLNIKVEIPKSSFGEGITLMNNKIYQLTYQSKIGYVYNATNFLKIREFQFNNKEGWGITNDGKYLIMSDGTSAITFLSPNDFSVVKRINVFDEKGEVINLNELEFINGFIYANVYTTDFIYKIDTISGKVVGKIDLTSLAYEARSIHKGSLELNGIAYDSVKKLIYVTGKMWPKLYQISFPH